jgi:RNA polymerase sigma-70 factor, ECF subfamily
VEFSEQELIARAKQGDVEAFEAMLGPSINTAHRFAYALLHDPNLAEDAVQDASVRAWRKLARLRSDGSFLQWFLGIVARQCRDQMRGRWWQVIRTPETPALSADQPEETALLRARLREAFAKLAGPERQILILRLYLDLPWGDVAGAAGLTEAGARSRYYRALGRLRPVHGAQEVFT